MTGRPARDEAAVFFVATLFQPERRALAGGIPPLTAAFLQAIARSPVAPARFGR